MFFFLVKNLIHIICAGFPLTAMNSSYLCALLTRPLPFATRLLPMIWSLCLSDCCLSTMLNGCSLQHCPLSDATNCLPSCSTVTSGSAPWCPCFQLPSIILFWQFPYFIIPCSALIPVLPPVALESIEPVELRSCFKYWTVHPLSATLFTPAISILSSVCFFPYFSFHGTV